jgi:hypothetical protein
MRMNDAPEHDWPDCELHPPLVYEDSVGPGLSLVRADESRTGSRTITTGAHVRWEVCRDDWSTDGRSAEPAKESTREGMLQLRLHFARGDGRSRPVPNARRNFDGSYNRVETALKWRCTGCQTTEDFKHADLLGFN